MDTESSVRAWLAIMIGLVVMAASSVRAETPADIPCKSLVVDHAGVLSVPDIERLNKLTSAIETQTSDEVAVVTVHNLGGLSDVDFSLKYWDRCRIGKTVKNNGILLLLAIDDKKVRLGVGYGLESVVTDPIAGKILDAAVIPQLIQRNYFQAIYEGVVAVQKLLMQPEVKKYFAMPWDVASFERYATQFPKSPLHCDALMMLGRFYEDEWNGQDSNEAKRQSSVASYGRYLKECPLGKDRVLVQKELDLILARKHDNQRYLR